eukprot:SAG31_NODE_23053_length_512_cov_1.000000_1_plen_66_part_10
MQVGGEQKLYAEVIEVGAALPTKDSSNKAFLCRMHRRDGQAWTPKHLAVHLRSKLLHCGEQVEFGF